MTTGVRPWILAAMALGLALATAVAGYVGFGHVLVALARIGWRGLGALVAWSALPYCLLGTAWFLLLPGRPAKDLGVFIAARVIRDSTGELLPFTQVGGFAAGARAAVLLGLRPSTAVASTVVDVTTELIAQLGFTALGLAMLAARLGSATRHSAILGAGVVGLGLTAAAAALFILFQKRGTPLLARFAGRFAPGVALRVDDLGAAVNALYEPPLRLAAATSCHFAAWLASAAGVWLALRLAGSSIGLGDMLAIESLVYAVRSAAFVAPMAAGIQEATYAIIGPIFGLPAEMSLAVSLIKRARDLAIGLPALALWQAFEGRRLLRRATDLDSPT
ncbi:MAG: lysylphosphatidylglycerol synthase domain-containing protein [Caulobacteraceae bacterium]